MLQVVISFVIEKHEINPKPLSQPLILSQSLSQNRNLPKSLSGSLPSQSPVASQDSSKQASPIIIVSGPQVQIVNDYSSDSIDSVFDKAFADDEDCQSSSQQSASVLQLSKSLDRLQRRESAL